MNYLPRFLSYIAALTVSPLSANAGQLLTNNLTVSMTLAFQQSERESSTAWFVPAPRTQPYTTKDLIAQMSKSFPTISTNKGTTLQIVTAIDEENAPVVFQVKNTNGVITPIPSSVLSITNGSVNLYSYVSPKKLSILKSGSLQLVTIFYDDTTTETNQSTNGIRFSTSGVASFSSTFTPTQIANSYRANQIVSQRGATGEGSLFKGVDTNGSPVTTGFVITSSSFTATGTGTVTFEPQN